MKEKKRWQNLNFLVKYPFNKNIFQNTFKNIKGTERCQPMATLSQVLSEKCVTPVATCWHWLALIFTS